MITERLSSVVIERLSTPADDRRKSIVLGATIALELWALILLILWTARAVVYVDSQTFAVLAAFVVAGVIWAFKKWG